jgi:branched-chain amino acid transport system ATP-binding protein
MLAPMMLAVDDLHVAYGRVQALRGVSLAVAAGELVALLGANGAGKSTLLAAICGVRPAQRGTVALEGRPIQRLRSDAVVRLGVALVPERRDLFPDMSVLENLAMGAYTRHDQAAIRADLDEVLEWFPVLAERRRQLASTLSGGEQQMLAIGRAMMLRPRLLLLDEPSLGVAPLILERIFAIIQRISRARGTTILLVEQNTAIALALASRAYVLETGRIVAAGTSAELKASDAIRRSYLGEG